MREGVGDVAAGGAGAGTGDVARLGGLCTLAGTVLTAVFSALHPVTFDPRAPGQAAARIAATPWWSAIHWGLAAAIVLLGAGLLTLVPLLERAGGARFARWAAGATAVSTALWVTTFVAEAAGGPALAAAWPRGGEGERLLVASTWASLLAWGYAAAFLLGTAVLLWSLDLARLRLFPRWLAGLGLLTGAGFALVQPAAWLLPRSAVPLLLPPSTALALWLLATGWIFWRRFPGEPAARSR